MNRALTLATMRLQLLTIALSLPMAACAMEVAGEDDVGLDETEIIIHNNATNEQLLFNSITGEPNGIAMLVNSPLHTDTYHQDYGLRPNVLNDPNARAFLGHLVRCALTSSQSISYTAFDGQSYVFRGETGLCSDWGLPNGSADQSCQEIVSACLLTHNNVLGHEVNLSILGKKLSGVALATSSTVPVKTTTYLGATIASFKPCAVSATGATRNCGWATKASLVGTCTEGTNVTLSCAANSQPIVTRICDTPGGCNHVSSLNLKEDTVCSGSKTKTSFTCGEDGAFSVMIAPVSSKEQLAGSFASASGGTFPASEKQVNTYEEGSFYGNILSQVGYQSAVQRTVDASGVITSSFPNGNYPVFKNSFACHDKNWLDANAYMSHRLCALVDENGQAANMCLATDAGVCFGVAGQRCATGDDAPINGDGDNGSCLDDPPVAAVWQRVLTTKLHQPCDLIPPGLEAVCERAEHLPQ